MKSRLSGALCACIFTLASIPVMESANAAFVDAVTDNGNSVIDVGSVTGMTYLEVHFNNLNPVWIDLDNTGAAFDPFFGMPTDQMLVSVYNDTGIPWTDFHFEFTNASILQPLNIEPQTGLVTDLQITDTAVWLFFNPPEEIGLLNGQGVIGTPNDLYSFHLQPTAVPLPAAVWLFGSGLLGLVGMARRKKA